MLLMGQWNFQIPSEDLLDSLCYLKSYDFLNDKIAWLENNNIKFKLTETRYNSHVDYATIFNIGLYVENSKALHYKLRWA